MNKNRFPDSLVVKMRKRADKMFQRILPFLKNSQTVIDVGSGNCLIAKNIQNEGKKITAVDIKDDSYEPSIKVQVYDGKKLPYKDNSFDMGLLLTVMHHAPSPEKIFREVARVSKKMIVIETSYRNFFEKILIVFFDSLLNLQPVFFWNSFKTDGEWRQLFNSSGYKIVKSRNYIDKQIIPYLHLLYYLEKK